MQKLLVIQTAFIGDVVLATSMAEKLKQYYPDATIDYLVRKGNESLLLNNPYISSVLIWDKKKGKRKSMFALISQMRSSRYDMVINLQRYFSTGLMTALSGAKETRGFDKNPLSFLYSKKIKHTLGNNRHEVDRNNDLIADITDDKLNRPKLFPSQLDEEKVWEYIQINYVTVTPSSVWFTKQYPVEKWIDLINNFDPSYKIYLLGGPDNVDECTQIIDASLNKNITLLAGKLSFLQSAVVMKYAKMNYTNDSAPLHFASGVNAPVTSIFCSTVPAFGYTPLSDVSYIVETKVDLKCRPCGTHGYKACPLGHFKCAHTINTNQLLETFTDANR